jgi:hypothetical protein
MLDPDSNPTRGPRDVLKVRDHLSHNSPFM